jgi:hypothetical protein
VAVVDMIKTLAWNIYKHTHTHTHTHRQTQRGSYSHITYATLWLESLREEREKKRNKTEAQL